MTTKFHRLTASAAVAEAKGEMAKAAELRVELKVLHKRYQEASVVSTAAYSTSTWVARCIARLGAGRRVLEIGAVNTQLLDSTNLQVRAVDVRSTHPRIEELDFFRVRGTFDVVVCSLVLNCLPRERRLPMLKKLEGAAPGGLVFLVVPRSCLERSRHLTPEGFDAVLQSTGFLELERRLSPKLVHLVLTPRARPFRPDPSKLRPLTLTGRSLERRKPTNDFAF